METLGWTILILAIITFALWVYVIADIVKGSLDGNGSKVLWLIVVFIFPIVGALVYLMAGKANSR